MHMSGFFPWWSIFTFSHLRFVIRLAVVVISACCYVEVVAWGMTGHRVVGALAERHLTEKTQAAVREILSGYKLQDVSNWMDDIKSENSPLYKSVYGWHFMDMPDPDNWHPKAFYPEVQWPHDLNESLQYVVTKLRQSDDQGQFNRAAYLRMLVHLVADAHQPLHVGNGADRGANRCYVRWFYSKWPTTLHSVWDSKLIDSTRYNYSEYVDYLDHVDHDTILQWQRDPLQTWLIESRKLHDQVYPVTQNTRPEDYCVAKRSLVKRTKMPVLSYSYSYTMRPIVEKRLQQAGLRLAGVLNDIFDGSR